MLGGAEMAPGEAITILQHLTNAHAKPISPAKTPGEMDLGA